MQLFNKPKNQIIFTKENCYDNCKIILAPKLIISNSEKDINLFKEKTNIFLKTVYNECPNFNFERFLMNFEKTKFNIDIGNNSFGSYGGVTYNRKHVKYYINTFGVAFHEFFHLSTSFYSSTLHSFFSGFHFRDNDFDLGVGINEGYTQLLTERYFKNGVEKTYLYEVEQAKLLEKIIGKDIMEEAYFKSSLNRLIFELEKYNTRENVIKYIENIDFIKNYYSYFGENKKEENEKSLKTKIIKGYDFLYECLKTKLKLLKQNLSDEEFKKIIYELKKDKDWPEEYITNKLFEPNDEDIIKTYKTEIINQ